MSRVWIAYNNLSTATRTMLSTVNSHFFKNISKYSVSFPPNKCSNQWIASCKLICLFKGGGCITLDVWSLIIRWTCISINCCMFVSNFYSAFSVYGGTLVWLFAIFLFSKLNNKYSWCYNQLELEYLHLLFYSNSNQWMLFLCLSHPTVGVCSPVAE